MTNIGVAISPSGEIKGISKGVYRELSLKGIPLSFGLKAGFIPHVTLYQGVLDPNLLSKAMECLEGIVRETRPFVIKMKPELEVRPSGNIFWNVETSTHLRALHEFVAESMQEYSSGFIPESENVLKQADAEEATRIRRFGVTASGDKYHPHITIGRLAYPEDSGAVTAMKVPTLSFRLQEIFKGTINNYGQMSMAHTDLIFTVS